MSDWNLPLQLALNDARQIRSFVTRQGRLTKGQRQALDTLWPTIGLNAATDNIIAASEHAKARVFEIGFGNGASLAAMAQSHPETMFFGVEVHQPGIGALLQLVEEQQLHNIRLFYADARDVLAQAVPEASLDQVQIFFPDPWPKKRHLKRRIIQQPFIESILPKLKIGGTIHCATDWEPYAEHMLEVLSAIPALKNANPAGGAMDSRPAYRPETKFERRGQGLGHGVWDFVFERQT